MAKLNKEIEEINNKNKPIIVNEHTIQSDSDVRRFFKFNGLKIVNSGIASTLIFGAATVASAVLGGVAGLATIPLVAVSAGIGVGSVATHSAIVNKVNNDTEKRFKHLNLTGGVTEHDSIVNIIKYRNKEALKYRRMMQTKTYTVEETVVKNGKITIAEVNYKNNKTLTQKINRQEQLATKYMKYLLDQAVIISGKIMALEDVGYKMSNTEQEKLFDYRDKMERIKVCVNDVVNSRDDYNPYKQMIIKAMADKCLLGNDYQNEQIKANAESGSKQDIEKLYSIMFEQPKLQQIEKKVKRQRDMLELTKQEHQRTLRTQAEILTYQGDIAKVSVQNRQMAKQIQRNNEPIVEQEVDKRMQPVKQKIADLEMDLDNAQQGWYEAEQRVEKQTQKYERQVARRVTDRAQKRNLRQRAEDAEQTVQVLYDNYNESVQSNLDAELKLQQLSQQNERLTKSNKAKTTQISNVKNKLKESETQKARLQRQADLAGTFLDGFMDANDQLKEENEQLSNQHLADFQANMNNLYEINDLQKANKKLTVANEELKRQTEEDQQEIIDLAFAKHNLEKELSKSNANLNEAINDLLEQRNEGVRKEEELAEIRIQQQTQQEINDFMSYINLQSGKVRSLILGKLDKLEQRAVLSKEKSKSSYLDGILSYVDYARAIDLNEKELEELKDICYNLKMFYDANDKMLEKLPKNTKKKIDKVIDGIGVVIETKQITTVTVER